MKVTPDSVPSSVLQGYRSRNVTLSATRYPWLGNPGYGWEPLHSLASHCTNIRYSKVRTCIGLALSRPGMLGYTVILNFRILLGMVSTLTRPLPYCKIVMRTEVCHAQAN